MAHDIRPAAPDDIPLIVEFIRGLAEYEKLLDHVEATPDGLRASLFPADGAPVAHCVIGSIDGVAAGFALYFFNFSTFLGRLSLYLEDLYVRPEHRSKFEDLCGVRSVIDAREALERHERDGRADTTRSARPR
jgi:hypothetical protein